MTAIRRIRALFAVAAVSGAAAILLPGGQALATKGNCDPAPALYNVQKLAKGDGTVIVEVHYGWDGVSVYPDCAGPVLEIHYTNTGTDTWRAILPRKTRGLTFVDIPPGTDTTVTGNALRQAGLDTLDAIGELTVVRIS